MQASRGHNLLPGLYELFALYEVEVSERGKAQCRKN
jgi:hypothetical protein